MRKCARSETSNCNPEVLSPCRGVAAVGRKRGCRQSKYRADAGADPDFPPPVIERGSVEAPSAQEIERGQDVAPGDYLASVNFSTALGCGGPVTRVSADRRHTVTERDGGAVDSHPGGPAQHSVRRFHRLLALAARRA